MADQSSEPEGEADLDIHAYTKDEHKDSGAQERSDAPVEAAAAAAASYYGGAKPKYGTRGVAGSVHSQANTENIDYGIAAQTEWDVPVDNAAAADYGAKSKNGMGDFGVTMHSQDDNRDTGNGQREAIAGDGQREPSLDDPTFDWDNFLPDTPQHDLDDVDLRNKEIEYQSSEPEGEADLDFHAYTKDEHEDSGAQERSDAPVDPEDPSQDGYTLLTDGDRCVWITPQPESVEHVMDIRNLIKSYEKRREVRKERSDVEDGLAINFKVSQNRGSIEVAGPRSDGEESGGYHVTVLPSRPPGEIVKDSNTGLSYVRKPIKIWEIQKDGVKDTVKAWILLEERGLAPKLYCMTRKGNEVWLSMEHVKGETVKDVIATGKLKDPDDARLFALLLLQDLLKSLEALKEKKWAHKDIHGENVMIQPDLTFKLLDFEFYPKRAKESLEASLREDLKDITHLFFLAYISCRNDKGAFRRALNQDYLDGLHDHAKHLETESFTELFDLLELLVEAIKSKEVETDLIAAKVKSFFWKEADLPSKKDKLRDSIFPDLNPRDISRQDTEATAPPVTSPDDSQMAAEALSDLQIKK